MVLSSQVVILLSVTNILRAAVVRTAKFNAHFDLTKKLAMSAQGASAQLLILLCTIPPASPAALETGDTILEVA